MIESRTKPPRTRAYARPCCIVTNFPPDVAEALDAYAAENDISINFAAASVFLEGLEHTADISRFSFPRLPFSARGAYRRRGTSENYRSLPIFMQEDVKRRARDEAASLGMTLSSFARAVLKVGLRRLGKLPGAAEPARQEFKASTAETAAQAA